MKLRKPEGKKIIAAMKKIDIKQLKINMRRNNRRKSNRGTIQA